MKRLRAVLLFYNSKRRRAIAYAAAIERRLRAAGAGVARVCVNEHECRLPRKADAAVAVGGDGTVLYAARHAAPLRIPVLGINAGGLGFLSGAEQKQFLATAGDFLAGRYRRIKRTMLSVCVRRGGRVVHGPYPALNDCVIRSAEARAFTLRAYSGGKYLSEYFGDGLIVATPSGSTAYSLAASGPIVMPETEVLLLSPICPHTLTHRPIVLSAAEELRADVYGGRNGPQLLTLSLDGQENFTLERGDSVVVKRDPRGFAMLAPEGFDYFEVLRRKLSWGER